MGENFDGTTKEAPRPMTVQDYEQLITSLYHELLEERTRADELKQDAENWFNSYKNASNEVDELKVELSDKHNRAVELSAHVKELESERAELQTTLSVSKNDQAIAQQKADGLSIELATAHRNRKLTLPIVFIVGLITGLLVSYYGLWESFVNRLRP